MIDPAVLRAMLNAGCSADQIVAVAEEAARADEERKAEKRAGNAERQRRFRQRNAASRVTGVTNGDNLSPKERSPTPPKEITPIPVSEPDGSSTETRAFDQFWSIYPNKVGKRDAEKSFLKALKRANLETILAGLRRYVAKTDDRPWCNPSTWLNQDRWGDAPAVAPQLRSTAPPGRPRTVAELALHRLETGQTTYEPPDKSDRPLVQGYGSGQAQGASVLELVAIAANGYGRS